MPNKTDETQLIIEINEDWCKACGICIEFCPRDVFEVKEDGTPRVARVEDCIDCGLCELLCPDFAITVKSDQDG